MEVPFRGFCAWGSGKGGVKMRCISGTLISCRTPKRLSENPTAAGLRPAANSEGLRRQSQNVLNPDLSGLRLRAFWPYLPPFKVRDLRLDLEIFARSRDEPCSRTASWEPLNCCFPPAGPALQWGRIFLEEQEVPFSARHRFQKACQEHFHPFCRPRSEGRYA